MKYEASVLHFYIFTFLHFYIFYIFIILYTFHNFFITKVNSIFKWINMCRKASSSPLEWLKKKTPEDISFTLTFHP